MLAPLLNHYHLLQVLDLVVNGPIKQHLRRYRAKSQKESMRKYILWRESQELLPFEQRKFKQWICPKAGVQDGIKVLLTFWDTQLQSQAFKDSVSAVFLSKGSAPHPDYTFEPYIEAKKTKEARGLAIEPLGTKASIPFPQTADGRLHDEFESYVDTLSTFENGYDSEIDEDDENEWENANEDGNPLPGLDGANLFLGREFRDKSLHVRNKFAVGKVCGVATNTNTPGVLFYKYYNNRKTPDQPESKSDLWEYTPVTEFPPADVQSDFTWL